MSCVYIDDKLIAKTQKDHQCSYCGRTIPKGSPNVRLWKFNVDGEIKNDYDCHWCNDNSKDFSLWKEEFDFTQDIVEIFEKKNIIPGNCYFGGSDGDYFIFKDRETDKEVKRVHCPIISEVK
jgi:hypothetical protein